MDDATQLISYISSFHFGLLLGPHHVGEQREAYMEKQKSETMKWPQKPIRFCSSHLHAKCALNSNTGVPLDKTHGIPH